MLGLRGGRGVGGFFFLYDENVHLVVKTEPLHHAIMNRERTERMLYDTYLLLHYEHETTFIYTKI